MKIVYTHFTVLAEMLARRASLRRTDLYSRGSSDPDFSTVKSPTQKVAAFALAEWTLGRSVGADVLLQQTLTLTVSVLKSFKM